MTFDNSHRGTTIQVSSALVSQKQPSNLRNIKSWEKILRAEGGMWYMTRWKGFQFKGGIHLVQASSLASFKAPQLPQSYSLWYFS